MGRYSIELTREAEEDIDHYRLSEQRVIVAGVRQQLSDDPLVETRNRKSLRQNPIARWELRLGRHRVFYEVDEPKKTVIVVSVGHKVHSKLIIRGTEVQI